MKLPVQFDPIRKQLFVENLVLGLDPIDAAKAAGFTSYLKPIVKKLLDDEDVIEQIEAHKRSIKEYYDVSREKILRDLVDAKEMARVQGDVKGMVMAINPIIDVQGFRAPREWNIHKTEQPSTTSINRRLRQISNEELVELAEEDGVPLLELLPTVEEDIEG